MIKIVALCLLFGLVIVYLKSINSEIAMLVLIGAGAIVLFYSFTYIKNTFEFVNSIVQASGVDENLYAIVFKSVAIGILVEFGSGILEDFGLKSLSDKLVLFGKLMILSISIPIFYAVFNLVLGITG